MVISLRALETGEAKDVSGVMRITKGPASTYSSDEVEERELLYLNNSDGSVRVFERGSSV